MPETAHAQAQARAKAIAPVTTTMWEDCFGNRQQSSTQAALPVARPQTRRAADGLLRCSQLRKPSPDT
eukprot:8285524-Alexandrium_andersonii.AAC.1